MLLVRKTTQAIDKASNDITLRNNMKRFSILAIALLSASLSHVCAAQSAGSPVNTDSSSQTKLDKKNQKVKPKPTATKAPIKAETGKKTTTSQDAAYALAARKGNQSPAKVTFNCNHPESES